MVASQFAVADVPLAELVAWNKLLAGVVNQKLGLRRNASPKYLHLAAEDGGLGLKDLTAEVAAGQVCALMQNGLQSEDPITRAALNSPEAYPIVRTEINNALKRALPPGHRRRAPRLCSAKPGNLGTIVVSFPDGRRSCAIGSVVRHWNHPRLKKEIKAALSADGKV